VKDTRVGEAFAAAEVFPSIEGENEKINSAQRRVDIEIMTGEDPLNIEVLSQ
jgi:hypothetical protein